MISRCAPPAETWISSTAGDWAKIGESNTPEVRSNTERLRVNRMSLVLIALIQRTGMCNGYASYIRLSNSCH